VAKPFLRLPIHLDSILYFLASFHYISERNLRATSTIFLNDIQNSHSIEHVF